MMKKLNVNLINPTGSPDFSARVSSSLLAPGLSAFNIPNLTVFPGFCDVHVHFREPGFSYKETIYSGSRAAARGGYTAVCTMPNLNPVPDSPEALGRQLSLIEDTACIHVYPYGAITQGEKGEALAELEAMAPQVAGFSDDGRGVQSEEMMRRAMERAKALGKPIVAHCEVNELLRGGYIHDGDYARQHGHRMGADCPGFASGGRNRLQIPCLPHFHQRKRGTDSAGQETGRGCDNRNRPPLPGDG